MTDVTRREVATPPQPTNWHSVTVQSLKIYREAQDDSYTENKMVPRTNDDGLIYYRDPQDPATNVGWYIEGEQPDGWEAELIEKKVLVPRTKRGEVSGISIVEEDASGAPIPRGTEGYAEFQSFNMEELRTLAQANPALVGGAYNTAVSALQALADAIYSAVNQ